MDRATFWRLVEQTRPANNSPERHCRALVKLLAKQDPEEIIAFEGVFTDLHREAYRADIWSAIGEIDGLCSDDAFMDFRAWLVMQGQDVYETVLESPEYLGEITLRDCVMCHEEYNYVASHAYQKKTGEEEMPERGRRPPLRLKGTFIRTERSFKRRFPMLWRLLKDPPKIDRGWLKWNDGTVAKAALAIHEERRWSELPILADALEEAGCQERFLLDHCRAGRRHARRCWVTNFLLGRR
jgi:hypothetical protein